MAPAHTIARNRILRGTEEWKQFSKFVAPPPEPPRTLDRATGGVRFNRKLVVGYDMPLPYKLPNGKRSLAMWVIADPDRQPTFPGPLLRIRAGRTALITTKTAKGPHTIHWHGIEGTPLNDGVGKHSFEIQGEYVFQWTAREPGFYFYHCHRNTPLHFEMGLYGALIVDPEEGEGHIRAYSPATGHVVRYDRELIWVAGAHDHRWRDYSSHAFGMHERNALGDLDPNDPDSFPDKGGGLGDWRPTVFTISGAVANGSAPITDRRAAGTAKVGETVLIRLLNASYAIQECRLGVDALVIAEDGRSFGVPPFGSYSQPYTIPAGTPFRLTSAMRFDILVRPTAPGTIPFRIDYLDWLAGTVRGRAATQIVVT